MAKYVCPAPNSISPFFEIGFVRLEYVGDNKFDLAYFRHTGKWLPIFFGISIEDALELVKKESLFIP